MIENEVWSPIKIKDGIYAKYYSVSNLGRIKSHDREVVNSLGVKRIYKGRIIKPYKSGNGHLQVKLYSDASQSQEYVHRLVAEEFVENPNGLPFINHLDGNKENNVHTNLKWCTQAENVAHAIQTGLHNPHGKYNGRARSVINCKGQVFETIVEAAKEFGLKTPAGINQVCKGIRNYAGKYHNGEPIKWKYYKDVKHE